MRGTIRLWLTVAERSFRRYSTYRVSVYAGVFTNVIFGVITAYVYLTLWHERPGLGGYDATDAVTYTWIGQALIIPVAVWGGGFQEDFTQRIRTGDIAIDLYRPSGLIPWWLAADLGRASFHLLSRAVPMFVAGAVLFGIRMPSSPIDYAAFLLAVYLATIVSFGLRFLVSLTAFWLLDSRGAEGITAVIGIFASGLILPLVVFPQPFRAILTNLPWSAFVQTPADIWLGKTSFHGGTLGALGFEAGWAVVMVGAAYVGLTFANRAVVVQGG